MEISNYVKLVPKSHRDSYGQVFTPPYIAEYMAKWVIEKYPKTILDPAVGNNIFFDTINRFYSDYTSFGFEVDKIIYDHYALYDKNISNSDFLTSEWNKKYDAIIANPPYFKFQKIKNRASLLYEILKETGINLSGLSNYCLYFFVKSIFQLNAGGRLAFIMPYGFLDGQQGNPVKQYLIKHKLLKSITFLKYNDVFDNVVTTAAIYFIEKANNENVSFITFNTKFDFLASQAESEYVFDCTKLATIEKWSNYSVKQTNYNNSLVKFKSFVDVKRGIATGINKFFLLSNETIEKFSIPQACYKYCISSSCYYKNSFLTANDIKNLRGHNKILIVNDKNRTAVEEYIEYGERNGYDKGYLTSHRKPWFELEKQRIPDILIATTTREALKIIYNESDCIYLTSFHGIYIKKEYSQYKKIIFCFLKSDIFSELLQTSLRTVGNGLFKVQPNDINNTLSVDFRKMAQEDIKATEHLFSEAQKKGYFDDSQKKILNTIFTQYVQ